MLKYIIVASTAILALSCSSEQSKPKAELKTFNEKMTKEVYRLYGENITANPIYSMESFNDVSDPKVASQELAFEGLISSVCKKKGCWMAMKNPNGEDLHVSFDYVFLVPKNADGRRAVIQGTLRNDTTSVDYLKHLAEDAGKPQSEIDKITEPKISKTFLAQGVNIKKKK
ncbi:MAG: DUF4920 domain-containing protein [Flavobacteriales bacterium]